MAKRLTQKTVALPHPATHDSILNGWPGGGEGWRRLQRSPMQLYSKNLIATNPRMTMAMTP